MNIMASPTSIKALIQQNFCLCSRDFREAYIRSSLRAHVMILLFCFVVILASDDRLCCSYAVQWFYCDHCANQDYSI